MRQLHIFSFILGLFLYCGTFADAHALPLPADQVAILRSTPGRPTRLACFASGTSYKLGKVTQLTSSNVELVVQRSRKLGSTLFTKALRECKKAFAAPVCSDKRDNDLDGTRDFPKDTDCSSRDGTSESSSSSPPAGTAPPLESLELFSAPFTGEYAISNHFDHEYPRQFQDNNGFQRTTDGEVIGGIDGHDGYDFRVPEGTPLLALADGQVTFAGSETPFFCPLLNQTVSGLKVIVRHQSSGRTFDAIYLHLSSVGVNKGDTVLRGQQLGLSGTTGCSTGPHLHLEISERKSGVGVVVDPFSWSSTEQDPWALDAEGARSPLLWRTGEAPSLYREAVDDIDSTATASIGITRVRWMGRRDDLTPANEFVEFTVNSRVLPGASYDLGGAKVRNNAGDEYIFPVGTTITDGTSIRLYSGPITESETVKSWNRSSPAWSNSGDCVQLITKAGRRMYTFVFGGGTCPSASSTTSSSKRRATVVNHGEAVDVEMDMKAIQE